ncbi:MAG: hypothetical protein AAF664_16790 [Planctomycetota bacterium]
MAARKLTSRFTKALRDLAITAAGAIFASASLMPVHAEGLLQNAPPADPFAFDPDFRWFEPVQDFDLIDMKPKYRAPHGWFATYDRLYLYGSRPETDDEIETEFLLDSGYGHRYEVGFMNEDDRGWSFNYTEHMVVENFTVRAEAANRFLDPANATSTDPTFGFIRPPGGGNNLGSDYRFFDVDDTFNHFKYKNFELNRTWRMEPYHYGGILEPMIGVRYINLIDFNQDELLNTFADLTSIAGQIFPETLVPQAVDQLLTDQSITENDMLLGQIGFRYFKYRHRFVYMGDFRVFSGQNWQSNARNTEELIVVYNDTAEVVTIGAPEIVIDNDATDPVFERNSEFVVGFEVRAEIGYQLTKMIQVRTGVTVLDIATGVWRGGETQGRALGGDQDQDLVMVGFNFGLSLNH